MINGFGPLKEIKSGVFEVLGKNAGILVIKESPSTGEMMIAPDVGYYTLTRVGFLSNPKTHSLVMLGLFAVCLLGFFALIGRKKAEYQKVYWLNLSIACVAALLPLMFVVGYPEGQNALVILSMGHIGRLLLMVADVNILLIISLWACWYIRPVWRTKNTALCSRVLMTVVPLSGVLMSLIFAKYHMIGLFLP